MSQQIYHSLLCKAVEADNFEVRSHNLPDENGELQAERYVEFDVIGMNRTWRDQIPYDQFVVNNPLVNIE